MAADLELSDRGFALRPLESDDRGWVASVVAAHFGSARVVSRGRLHEAAELPGWLATLDGERAGLVQYRREPGALEVVTLVSLYPRRGIGRRLLEAALALARRDGLERVWLVTTDNNLGAIAFYEALGWHRAAVHRDAVAEARRLKPELPERDADGRAIRDEIEYEWRLVGDESAG